VVPVARMESPDAHRTLQYLCALTNSNDAARGFELTDVERIDLAREASLETSEGIKSWPRNRTS
jgi:hypothetical protein